MGVLGVRMFSEGDIENICTRWKAVHGLNLSKVAPVVRTGRQRE